MPNEKMENLLNLALEATQEEREKSLELDIGYDSAEQTWEVIVKFVGTTEELEALLFRGGQWKACILHYAAAGENRPVGCRCPCGGH